MASVDFKGFGISITGAAHIRNKCPNQDFVIVHCSEENDYVIASVCDGHGGDKFIRSHIGAKIAAQEITQLMKDFYVLNPEFVVESKNIQEEKIERLKKNILYYWQKCVSEYNIANPILNSEYTKIEEKKSFKAREEIENNNIVAYGTTVISVLLTQNLLLCLQLGDGDVVFLYPNSIVENPMGEDERLFANETTSLCSDSAILDFRVKCITNSSNEKMPCQVMLSTDGISNSFNSYNDFLNLAYDIKDGLIKEGVEITKDKLKEGLQRLTNTGSGDDVTIAVVWGMME